MTVDVLKGVYTDFPGIKASISPKVFRATVRTHLQAMGCPAEVRSRISHHQRQSRVEQSYDKHTYDDEAREWWEKWGTYLQQVEKGGSNVVPLRRKK